MISSPGRQSTPFRAAFMPSVVLRMIATSETLALNNAGDRSPKVRGLALPLAIKSQIAPAHRQIFGCLADQSLMGWDGESVRSNPR